MSCFEIRIERVIVVLKTAIHYRLAVEADKHFLKKKNVHAVLTFLIRSSSGQRKIKYAHCFGYVMVGYRNLVLLEHSFKPSACEWVTCRHQHNDRSTVCK